MDYALNKKFVLPLCVVVLCLLVMSCTGKSTEVKEVRGTFDTDEGKELMRQFGLPDGLMGIGSIALGYPEIVPQQPVLFGSIMPQFLKTVGK